MNEITVLAELLQHADRQIDVSVNLFLVVMGIIATVTMTKAYEEKFTWPLKVLLSVGLTVMLWANRNAITDQMTIYNAILAQIPDVDEPWKTLFGDHTVYTDLSPTLTYWIHAISSLLIHVLVWHKEIKLKVGKRLTIWWKGYKARRA